MLQRSFALGALFGCGLCLAPIASALPILTITPAGPTSFALGQANAEITFNFVYSNVTQASDVLVYQDAFVGYNPAVLTLKSYKINDYLSADPGDKVFGDGNYKTSITNGNPLPSGWVYNGLDLGDPVDMGTYWEGSLAFTLYTSATDPESELFTSGSGYPGQYPSFVAFSVTFDVVTTQIANSAIVMIDDRSYLSNGIPVSTPTLDYKYGNDQTSFYPFTITSDVDVPAPAPLALMGLPLALMGLRRRLICSA